MEAIERLQVGCGNEDYVDVLTVGVCGEAVLSFDARLSVTKVINVGKEFIQCTYWEADERTHVGAVVIGGVAEAVFSDRPGDESIEGVGDAVRLPLALSR